MSSEPIEVIRELLERALAEEGSRGSVRVPPYPATALKLQKVLGEENYTTQQLVDAMRADPVFAANLLRLANSPFYKRGAEVTSLSVAVQRIGARELTRLALASTVSQLSGETGPLHALRRELWRQALSSAMVCEILSKIERADEGEGFVAGLLHDVGKLLVVGAIEDMWHKLKKPETIAEETWRAVLADFHVRFGQILAQRWRLPGLLGAVLTTHHDEPQTLGPLTRRVVVADSIVGLMESETSVPVADLQRLGLTVEAATTLCAHIPQVPAAVNAFEPRDPKAATPKKAERPADGGLYVEAEEARWRVTQVTPRYLEAQSDRALAPNLLFELTVQPHGLHFWAIVQRCVGEGAGWVVRLAPFALAPEDMRSWEELGARASGAAAA